MKTKTINLYSFEELSEGAKQKAIEELRPEEIFWAEENRQSMETFADLFPVKVTNWSYGGRGEGVDFRMTCEDQIEELTGYKLAKYLWNNYSNVIFKPKEYWICNGTKNCVGINAKSRKSKLFKDLNDSLTGYYMDTVLLSPIADFMLKPDNRNFEEVLTDCFQAWIEACNQDVEYQNSDEAIIERIEANEYTFTEDGKLEN